MRMPFGIHSAQEVFHKRINNLFEDLEEVETDIDDILFWGKTIEEHDQRLQATLDRTKMIGMTLNRDKCKFLVTEVTYLGHKLTGEGVQPDQTKIEAIIDMPAPQEKTRGAEAIRNGELPSQVYSRNVRDYGTVEGAFEETCSLALDGESSSCI